MASQKRKQLGTSLDLIAAEIVKCTRCPELREYAARVATEKRRAYLADEYWGKPVPAFGDPNAAVMFVGLAPGAHGSNRTGRPFTGDASGYFLYPALFRAGFASQPNAVGRDDGLELRNCIITSAGRCAPPANKLTGRQLFNCLPFLIQEFDALRRLRVIVALGAVGFDASIKVLRDRRFELLEARPRFSHGSEMDAVKAGRRITLLASFHPSRQNTNTGVLTSEMLDAVLQRAAYLAGKAVLTAGEAVDRGTFP